MSAIKGVIEQWHFLGIPELGEQFSLLGKKLRGTVDGTSIVTSTVIGKTPDNLGVSTDSGSVYILGMPSDVVEKKYPQFKAEVLERLPVVDATGQSPVPNKGSSYGSLDLEL